MSPIIAKARPWLIKGRAHAETRFLTRMQPLRQEIDAAKYGRTARPPDVKVPRKMTCLDVWLMSIKPPQPGIRPGPKFETFTLPTASTCIYSAPLEHPDN